MEPAHSQVKRAARRPRAARIGTGATALLLAAGAIAATGCAESRASRLYEEAQALVDRGEVAQAVELYERILERFPDTDIAVVARRDIGTYRNLAVAIERYPVRSAFDLMIRTARAIERYRDQRRSYPGSVGDLVPGYLAEAPRDPWGRELEYRPSADRRGYRLVCWGSDGRSGGAEDARDLIVENGRFVERPSKEEL